MNRKQLIFTVVVLTIFIILSNYRIGVVMKQYEIEYAACESVDFETEECFCYKPSVLCHDHYKDPMFFVLSMVLLSIGLLTMYIYEWLGR